MIDVDNDVILGFVPCHLQTDVCTAFGISHQDHHTVFAYRNGKKITTQVNLRDEEFYVEWIKMIKNHDPVNRLDSKEEFDQARKGIVKGFPNVRQAVTIGTFNSEESKEFQSFQKVANILNGRYHFLYRIVDSVSPSISTYRPIEKNKRTEYNGRFDVKSLLDHVTHSSVPSILDISNGFTSDIVYRNPNSLLLLIHNNHGKLVEELMVLANQPEFIKSHLLAQLDISNSLPTQTLFSKMKLEANHLPATCLFLKSEIQCFTTVDGITNILNDRIAKKPDHIIEINSKTAHPLKWIQLEHINKIFGHQDITLLPEPVAIKNIQNPHNFDGMDLGSISGCPMMAHLNNHLKDEL
uniref:Uncharacterized protein n=1 Tax=Acrobeloides nanus TaxID=290746 RepID=A0A914DQB6_9BILA